ncbi:DNA-processing protein DprA [Erythrobacter sp. HL-111]|uniref:DNA-processing protein DprA n=1 Tax=Erythrobacter sp. HL-111 TaxID=1798193 RepID=UPI0006DA882F|nr:DNA-processing protein DprA [Erythrobacter sp. HL-111]KPP90158.1 MAG: DNA protecting protein DprA [Erythrobacteraceae bacterium HL-111]SDR82484.1 DNA protecting protein DprA [Erythrobacter sp. HL-111]
MTGGALSQAEAFARIRLLRSPNIGPVSYAQLLARFGTAAAALDALPDLARRGREAYRPAPAQRIEREVEAVRRSGARYLFHDQPDYPALLGELESAPPILTCRGDLALAARPCVAIVGARNASAAAVKLARDFAAGLAEAGFTVVSGLARGIDGAAHEGALGRGSRATIGVIASGIDIAYPPQHADLQERIASEALLIAEQPPGTEPRGRHFPSRNRIIAGLASGTLVVEAAPRSGSLITARLAGEAGREVMAIPGSPLDTRSQGCNQLIRDGAVLVQSVEEVIELLEGFTGQPRSTFRVGEASSAFDYEELRKLEWGEARKEHGGDRIAGLLTKAPIALDELIRQSGATPAAVHMALLELELAGEIERHDGGLVSLSGASGASS